MNNDAWKAAVNPSSISSLASDPTAAAVLTAAVGSPSSSSLTEGDATTTPPAEPPTLSKAATKAVNKAARAAAKAAKAAEKTAVKAAAAAGNNGDNSCDSVDNCETAPASPGSPASSSTVVRLSPATSPPPILLTATSIPEPVVSTATAAVTSAVVSSVGPSGSSAAPWDCADGSIVTAANGSESGESGEKVLSLSDSLRLETDFELEPGVDLKADLGLPIVATGDGAPGFHTIMAIEGKGKESEEPLVEGNDSTVILNSSSRPDDLGFEMIEKEEAVLACAGETLTGAGGEAGSGKTRKGWLWAWSRS